MKLYSIKTISYSVVSMGLLTFATTGMAEPTYGISMSGTLDLPPDFNALPYVNPDAEPGGRIVYSEYGSFDSFSPFIVAGKTPYGFKAHIYESFLKRSVDESFSLYGLLAESIDMPEDRSWVEFHLNPDAKFSDGSLVTMEDVLWSYNILAEKGLPKYARYMAKVESMEQTSDSSVKFTLNTEDRELPLILGLIPIMKKADFDGVEFDEGMSAPTTGSGAYVVEDYKMGEWISFSRNPDYWGKDLPINNGLNNLDEIKYVYFTDSDAMFEAFKAGDSNIFAEGEPKRWNSYDFERYNNGDAVKTIVDHSRPSGMDGFIFNTRRAPLDDWRVREALITGFNFPFVNQTINDGVYPRRDSYFSNSYLGMSHDAAKGRVAELIEPYAADLPPGALEGYSLPEGNASGRDRNGVAHAVELLAEAGYSVQDGVMKNEDGEPLEISVMVKSPEEEQLANLWRDGLAPIGVTLKLDVVDANTHQDRLEKFDYDVVRTIWGLSLSPGNEQFRYWGQDTATVEGTRNYMGANEPAIDAMINAMLSAASLEDYTAAVKSLDRVLMAGRYAVPIWHNPEFWLIHDKELKFPEYVPKFGYWPGYAPDALYWEE